MEYISNIYPSAARATVMAALVACSLPAHDQGGADDVAPGHHLVVVDAGGASEPSGDIVFPPRGALTDQASLRVRGTAGGDAAVAAVRVNGVAASSSDGFATWDALVPLAPGENTLSLEVEDITGQVRTGADQVQVLYAPVILQEPRDLALDAGARVAYVIDSSLRAVVAVRLDNGLHTIVSSDAVGLGPRLQVAFAIALDLAGGRALVVDAGRDALVAVDLATGDRTDLSSSVTGTGPVLSEPYALALDAAANRVLVVDAGLDAVLAVDLATGDRTVLSNTARGVGPALVEPRGLALDGAGGRVLVTDQTLDALLAVDLATGDRTVVSDDTSPGSPFYTPGSIALGPSAGHALVLDGIYRGVVQVDLTTGERTLLSSGIYDLGKVYEGSGPLFSTPRGLIVDPVTDTGLVVDSGIDLIVSVDPVTGRRSFPWGPRAHRPTGVSVDLLSGRAYAIDVSLSGVLGVDLARGMSKVIADDDRGAGQRVVVPLASVYDMGRARLWFVDSVDFDDNDWYSAVVAMDIASSDRSIVSRSGLGTDIGAGPDTERMAGMVLQGSRVIVSSSTGANQCYRAGLMSVDMASGDRDILSATGGCGSQVGNGPLFGEPTGMTGFGPGTHVLVLDAGQQALYSVALESGDRELVSSAARGTGPAFHRPYGIALDSTRTSALVTNESGHSLLSVDLASGDRSLISGPAKGQGPLFQLPAGVALDIAPGVALVAEHQPRGIFGGLYMVDLQTGERVFLWD